MSQFLWMPTLKGQQLKSESHSLWTGCTRMLQVQAGRITCRAMQWSKRKVFLSPIQYWEIFQVRLSWIHLHVTYKRVKNPSISTEPFYQTSWKISSYNHLASKQIDMILTCLIHLKYRHQVQIICYRFIHLYFYLIRDYILLKIKVHIHPTARVNSS